MNFLDKLQDSVYDIIGYLIPGLLTIFILTPSVILYKDNKVIVTPIEIVYNNSNWDNIKSLINVDFSTNKGIAILILAYLLGHLIKFLAIQFYELVIFIEKKILKVNTQASSIISKIINKSKEIYEKNFNDLEIESYNYKRKERQLATYGRTQIRMHNVPSLIQKYISKYNLYCSLAFITFMLYLNTFIIVCTKHITIVGISGVFAIAIHTCISKKINTKKVKNDEVSVSKGKTIKGNNNYEEKDFFEKVIESLGRFSGVLWFLIAPIAIVSIIDKKMVIYLVMNLGLILFYITFDNEYRKHYSLHVKEALFGIIYVDEN